MLHLGFFGIRNGGAVQSALSANATINGQTEQAFWRYKGSNATASQWTAELGPNLSVTNVGADPTPGTDSTGAHVLFNGSGQTSDGYRDTQNGRGGFGTIDFLMEFIIEVQNGDSTQAIANTRQSGQTLDGFSFYRSGNNTIHLNIEDSGGNTIVNGPSTTNGNKYHVLIYGDRNDNATTGCRFYVNGAGAGTATNISARSNSLDGDALTLGRSSDFDFQGKIYECMAWKKADWFPGGASNTTEMDTFASARYNSVKTVYPWASWP